MTKTQHFFTKVIVAPITAFVVGMAVYLPFMLLNGWFNLPTIDFVGVCFGWFFGFSTFIQAVSQEYR